MRRPDWLDYPFLSAAIALFLLALIPVGAALSYVYGNYYFLSLSVIGLLFLWASIIVD